MKNITLVMVSMIMLVILFTSCKKDNSVNPSKQEKVTYNKSDSSQNIVAEKKELLKRFKGLDLSNEMLEKIISHTTEPKVIKIIKNSWGLEKLLGHPVPRVVTVINPSGTVLENFDANLNYPGDIVVKNRNNHVTVFRSSFVSHEGDHLITSNRQSLILSDNENTELEYTNFNYEETSKDTKQRSTISINDKPQITQPISANQNDTNSNGVNNLKSNPEDELTVENLQIQKEDFSSESLEKYKLIEEDINQTISRISELQAKLEDPNTIKNDDLKKEFEEELRYHYDLLDKQRETKKDLDNLTNSNEADGLLLKSNSEDKLESKENLQTIEKKIQKTMSRIVTLQAKLEDPSILKNNNLKKAFEEDLNYQNDLLNKQKEIKKELESNKLRE